VIFRVLQIASGHTEQVTRDNRVTLGRGLKGLPSYQANGRLDDRFCGKSMRYKMLAICECRPRYGSPLFSTVRNPPMLQVE
jgi:hypothetical protein